MSSRVVSLSFVSASSTTTTAFAITGMGCETCEVDITDIIKRQDGVADGRVDYYTGLAHIDIVEGFDAGALRDALEYAGYGLEADLSRAETHEKKSPKEAAAEASAEAEARRREEKAAEVEQAAADPDGDGWLD